jgi:hypothetical protein
MLLLKSKLPQAVMIDHLMGVFSQTVTVNGRCISFDAYIISMIDTD